MHSGAPHRIFEISELTTLIASQLALISQKSTLNLACTCRNLEEPALRLLWQTQPLLDTLLKVLPKDTWRCDNPGPYKTVLRITKDPSPEAWKRVQRYASWMRWASMGEIVEDTFRKLRLNSPGGVLFPALQRFYWLITESNIPYTDLFFSPYLREIQISPTQSWIGSGVPRAIMPAIASTVAALPASTLRSLRVTYGEPWADLEDALSSVALRCGPSLTEFVSPIPLSGAAINHLIHLPHLRIWYLGGSPPSYSNLQLPPVFPPLTQFTLWGGGSRDWLSLFKRLERGGSSTQGVTPLSGMKESLETLEFGNSSDLIINALFTTTTQIFRNLVFLYADTSCHEDGFEGPCPFKLDNDNVTRLAMALPRLERLLIGRPCFKNTCATTVACLLPISVHCLELQNLEIHFNTTNIVGDLSDLSENPRFEELRSLPRCSLSCLNIWKTPLTIDESDFEAVVNGMVDIFPCLDSCEEDTENSDWEEFFGELMRM